MYLNFDQSDHEHLEKFKPENVELKKTRIVEDGNFGVTSEFSLYIFFKISFGL